MIGIIYKFTILAKVRYDGHKPFYIGQHWCKSKDAFLCRDYPYYGSGTIWLKCIKKLKKSNSDNWRFFVKREILCVITNNSQKTLDKLEEFWIKREKSHHSDYTKKLIALTRKKYVGDKHPLYGCHFTWINNGEIDVRFKGTIIPPMDGLKVDVKRKRYESYEYKKNNLLY